MMVEQPTAPLHERLNPQAVSAWDDVAVADVLARVRTPAGCVLSDADHQFVRATLTALAPHLAARDAAVRREALEEAAVTMEARTQIRAALAHLRRLA